MTRGKHWMKDVPVEVSAARQPDILSLANQLAEAARKVTRQSCATAEDYNQRLDLKVALDAWDAAMKGRK